MLQYVRGKNLFLNPLQMNLFNHFFSSFASHLFSPDEYNHTDIRQQELNTANPCPFLILQTYLHHKICRKNCSKAEAFSVLHTAE